MWMDCTVSTRRNGSVSETVISKIFISRCALAHRQCRLSNSGTTCSPQLVLSSLESS